MPETQDPTSWTSLVEKSQGFFSYFSSGSLKRFSKIFGIVAGFLFIILYVILPFVLSSPLKERARQFIESEQNYFQVEKIDTSFFPLPTIHLKNVQFQQNNSSKIQSLSVMRIKAQVWWWDVFSKPLHFRKWTLNQVNLVLANDSPSFFDPSWQEDSISNVVVGLFQSGREVQIKKLSVRSADGTSLTDNLNIKLKGLSRMFPLEIKARGKLGSTKDNLTLSIKLWFDRLKPRQSKIISWFKLKQADLSRVWIFLRPLQDYSIQSGIISMEGQCRSRGDVQTLRYFGKSHLENLRFMKTSGAGQGQIDMLDARLDFTLFLKDGRLDFQKTRLDFTQSRLDLDGTWCLKASRGETDFTLSAPKLDLKEFQSLIRPWVELDTFQLRLGGKARLNFSVHQKQNQMQASCDLDLQPASIVWRDWINKKEGVPFSLSSRWGNRNEKSEWKGDFNLKSRGTSIKGAVTEWKKAETGAYQINLITNKMDFAQLASVLPWCETHEARGKAKILINRIGKLWPLSEWLKPEYTVNASFNDFAARWPGSDIKQVSGYVDVDRQEWEVRGLKWKSDNSQWKLNLVKRKLKTQNDLRFTAQVTLFNVASFLKDAKKDWVPPPLMQMFRLMSPVDVGKGRISFEKLMIGESVNERFDVDFDLQNLVLKSPPMNLKAYGGTLATQLEVRLLKNPQLILDLQASHLDLGNWFNSDALHGLSSFTTHLEGMALTLGDFQKTMQGSTQLSIENGSWQSVHLFKAFTQIPELSRLEEFSSKPTEFSRLETSLRFSDGLVHFSKLSLQSPDFQLQGEGNLGWDGTVTAQLRMTPDSYVLKKAFENDYRVGERAIMPFQVSGSWSQPTFAVDQNQLKARLFERLFKRV